jgi:hypothetical protein
MAKQEVRNDQQVTSKPKAPTPSQVARENINKVFEQLKRSLEREGQNVAKWEDLGALAQEALKSVREQFKTAAEKGPITADAVKAAYVQVRAAQRADGVIAGGPPKGDALSGLIDLSSFKIKQVDGGYTIAGLDAGHPLKTLLGLLKIGDVFPESIAGIIDTAAHSRNLRDLMDPKTWSELATQMAKAALSSGGTLKEKLAAAAVAAVQVATTEPKTKVDKEFGPVPQGKLDKESIDKTGKTTGEGSVANVTNIRAALLAGVKGQHKTIEETAGKILKAIFSEYQIDPDKIPKATRQELHKTLAKLLRDDSSVDGKISPEKLMQNAVRELAAADTSKLGEAEKAVFAKYLEDVKFLASGFEQILKMHPEGQDKPHVQAVITQLAAGAVGELFAAKMGHAVAKESRLIESINAAMKELTGQQTDGAENPNKTEKTEKTEKTGGSEQAQKTDGAKKVDGDRPWTLPDEISDTARAMAAQFLIQPPEGFPLKLGPGHPKFDEVVDVIASLLDQSSKGTKAGQLVIDGPKFAVDVWQWLVDNAKLDPVALERVKADLTDASTIIDEGNKLIADREAKIDELQKKKEGSAVKGELEDLENQITALEREVHQLKYGQGGLADIVGRVGMYQAEGLARVTEFVADPQMFEKDYGPEVAGAGGGGNKPPNGPPKGPGDEPEDDGRFRFFDRESTTGDTGLTGLFGGGRPEDYDGKNLTIQQQRAIKCGEILNDPSLCIEDKIFLFMMWFCAFADQEREQKMKELVQMDEREARLKKDKDETYRLLQSQVQTKKKKDVSRQQAEGEVNRIKNQMKAEPNNGALKGELDKANAKLQKAETEVNEADKAVQDLDKQHRALKRKEDRAPKSREVMFMELERLNKLRDMVMNMARTMMQNADRNIEKLFR